MTSPQTPGRRAQPSALRRTVQIVLVTGTVLALAAAFGPTWLVRVGLVVALLTAAAASILTGRELFDARRGHAREMLAASRRHGQDLSEERTRTGAVVDTLNARVASAGVVLQGQRVAIATLRGEISSLRGDCVHLRAEVEQRETVIIALRETVRSREAELFALHDEGGDQADVYALPRRVLAEHESTWADLPEAAELWSDGSPPTVVDLQLINTAMVLPNYEVERRVG